MTDESMTDQSISQDVIGLSCRKWEWMSAQNIGELAGLFHDEAVFVHMGATFTKEQELGVIEMRVIHYRDIDVKDVSVRFIADTAIVLSTIDLVAVVNDTEAANPFVVTEVYVGVDGTWRLGSMSFTRLLTA